MQTLQVIEAIFTTNYYYIIGLKNSFHTPVSVMWTCLSSVRGGKL